MSDDIRPHAHTHTPNILLQMQSTFLWPSFRWIKINFLHCYLLHSECATVTVSNTISARTVKANQSTFGGLLLACLFFTNFIPRRHVDWRGSCTEASNNIKNLSLLFLFILSFWLWWKFVLFAFFWNFFAHQYLHTSTHTGTHAFTLFMFTTVCIALNATQPFFEDSNKLLNPYFSRRQCLCVRRHIFNLLSTRDSPVANHRRHSELCSTSRFVSSTNFSRFPHLACHRTH